MKKAGVIALVFLYALSVMGINFAIHYCGEEVNSVSLGTKAKACCCEERASKMKDDCCTTKIISPKVTDTHEPAGKIKVAAPGVSSITTSVAILLPVSQSNGYKSTALASHSPPGNPLYLRFRNILI